MNKKQMFLLEVFDYYNKKLYKRRIAENLCDIEKWIESYAQLRDTIVEYIDDYGNGKILRDDGTILYIFHSTNIAMI